MMKWFSIFAMILLLVLMVGCKSSAPAGDDVTVTPETEQSVDDVDSDLADIDSLEADLDFSDLDALDEELDI